MLIRNSLLLIPFKHLNIDVGIHMIRINNSILHETINIEINTNTTAEINGSHMYFSFYQYLILV